MTTDDLEFAEWYHVYRRAREAEYPDGPTWFENELATLYRPTVYWDTRLWIAELDGLVVGAAVVMLPLSDNLERADIEVWVEPDYWRRGIGSALLTEVLAAARDAGRRSIQAWLEGPAAAEATSGTAFFATHGFTPRIREVTQALRAPFDLPATRAVEDTAAPHATGYRIVQWRDRVPDDLVDEYARMNQRMSTDAPSGELDYEEEEWDEARVRASEDRTAGMDRTAFATAAIAPDGSMAGATKIVAHVASDHAAYQGITIVDPRHRGHRLGLLMKAVNLRFVLDARPNIERIWTWNADSNSFMISVNEAVGYQVVGWGEGVQLDLPTQ